MKFIKKPVTVESIQYTGSNKPEIATFTNNATIIEINKSISVKTDMGWQDLNPGDWIVKDQNDMFYSVENDTFKKEYEAVE
ncbi:MAG: hypothetical protein ACT6FG_00320 [Methanosarcinaceae archaeon]